MIKVLVGRLWALGRVGGGKGGIEELHTCLLKCVLVVESLEGR